MNEPELNSKPQRYVHYLSSVDLADGGVVRAVLDLCAVLAARNTSVTLVTQNPKDVPQAWGQRSNGCPHVEVVDRSAGGVGSLSRQAINSLKRILAQADVLHLHTPWDPANVQCARLARRMGVPYVISAHGMLDDWSMAQKRWKKRLYMALRARQLLERAAWVHCTAQAEADQASKWFPNGLAWVAPCIVDLEPFKHLPGPELALDNFPALGGDEIKLLFLSRIHPKKGIDLLLGACGELARAGLRFTLVIAGPGEERYVNELKQLARDQGLADHVHFVGMVSGELKLSLYQGADLFVLPTHQENFGLVLPEAMACGTPVVTTRGVDIWKELQAGGASILDRIDRSALARTLGRLIEDHPTLADRGIQGRQHVFDWLDPSRVVEEYCRMYRQMTTPQGQWRNP